MIGIAGAGGIGSNVALNLIRAGLKDIKIIDFDNIEPSNLNRQFYFYDQIGEVKVFELKKNLDRIYNDLNIEVINRKLDSHNLEESFKNCNIVVEAFDKAKYKKRVAQTFLNGDKKVIMVSGIAGRDISRIKTKNIGNNITVVGDFESDIKDNPLYFPKINIVASMMADICLKYKEEFIDG